MGKRLATENESGWKMGGNFVYVLLFGLNGTEYGIMLKYVDFIGETKDVVKMADAAGRADGIVMLRGQAVPVYSLASRLGFAKQEPQYLLVVNVDDIRIALEIDSINRVIWTEKETVRILPVIVRTSQSCFREFLVFEKKLIGLLDIDSIIP